MSSDYLDELAALGDGSVTGTSADALTGLVERNPLPSVLAAAAAGAAAMALLSMMSRRDPDPLAPVPLSSPRGIDFESLRRQVAELADRIANTSPVETARQRAESAGESLADGWGAVRDQALDALHRFEPQASAAIKTARDNPVWTALVIGAVGALVGSQLLARTDDAQSAMQQYPSAEV